MPAFIALPGLVLRADDQADFLAIWTATKGRTCIHYGFKATATLPEACSLAPVAQLRTDEAGKFMVVKSSTGEEVECVLVRDAVLSLERKPNNTALIKLDCARCTIGHTLVSVPNVYNELLAALAYDVPSPSRNNKLHEQACARSTIVIHCPAIAPPPTLLPVEPDAAPADADVPAAVAEIVGPTGSAALASMPGGVVEGSGGPTGMQAPFFGPGLTTTTAMFCYYGSTGVRGPTETAAAAQTFQGSSGCTGMNGPIGDVGPATAAIAHAVEPKHVRAVLKNGTYVWEPTSAPSSSASVVIVDDCCSGPRVPAPSFGVPLGSAVVSARNQEDPIFKRSNNVAAPADFELPIRRTAVAHRCDL
jgi:hypothetical protein